MGFIPYAPAFCHPSKGNFGMLIALDNSSLTPHREYCVPGMEFLHRLNFVESEGTLSARWRGI